VNRDFTPLEPLDLARVDVHADDVVAGLSEAGARHQTDVTRTENRNFHA
jgi:hypothetical protein